MVNNMSLKFKEQALIGTMLGVTYLGATVAVNTLIEGTRASLEGIERLAGCENKEYVATLKSTRDIQLPQGHGKIMEGTFSLYDGTEVKIFDSPVILEGKYWPAMENLTEGQTYKVTAFDGMGGPRFIQAEKIR